MNYTAMSFSPSEKTNYWAREGPAHFHRAQTSFPLILSDNPYQDGGQHYERKECTTCGNCEWCHERRRGRFGGCVCGRYMECPKWAGFASIVWLTYTVTEFIAYNFPQIYSGMVDPWVVSLIRSPAAVDMTLFGMVATLVIIIIFMTPLLPVHKNCPKIISVNVLTKCAYRSLNDDA